MCAHACTYAVVSGANSHLVKLRGLLCGAPRQTPLAVVLVFVGVHEGEDDEERVMGMVQTCSADQL